uniref:Uncharacterized protein n=1 Tax=Arundo donax TaxID=35708 RepID=A0A0A9HNM3_ARUDO
MSQTESPLQKHLHNCIPPLCLRVGFSIHAAARSKNLLFFLPISLCLALLSRRPQPRERKPGLVRPLSDCLPERAMSPPPEAL